MVSAKSDLKPSFMPTYAAIGKSTYGKIPKVISKKRGLHVKNTSIGKNTPATTIQTRMAICFVFIAKSFYNSYTICCLSLSTLQNYVCHKKLANIYCRKSFASELYSLRTFCEYAYHADCYDIITLLCVSLSSYFLYKNHKKSVSFLKIISTFASK